MRSLHFRVDEEGKPPWGFAAVTDLSEIDLVDLIQRSNKKSLINTPEPPPIKNNHPAVWDLVLADMKERDEIGKQKYNTRLQPFNGRDSLVDAYQEALDLVVYLRQAIYERDNPGVKL